MVYDTDTESCLWPCMSSRKKYAYHIYNLKFPRSSQFARGRPPALACFFGKITTTPIDRYRTIVQNIWLRLVPPILRLQQVVIHCTAEYVLNFFASGDRELDMSHGQFYVVDSRKVQYNSDRDALISAYDYQTSHVDRCPDGRLRVTPITKTLTFRTSCRVPRVGCMLVGWGGNNGSTVTATVLANKLKMKWRTKDGIKVNYAAIVVWI